MNASDVLKDALEQAKKNIVGTSKEQLCQKVTKNVDFMVSQIESNKSLISALVTTFKKFC